MSPLPGTAPPIGKKLAAGPAHVDPAWGKRIDAWCGYPWKSPKVTAKLTVALARFVMPELEEPKPVSGNGDGDPYRTPATSTAPEPTTVPSEQDIRVGLRFIEDFLNDRSIDDYDHYAERSVEVYDTDMTRRYWICAGVVGKVSRWATITCSTEDDLRWMLAAHMVSLGARIVQRVVAGSPGESEACNGILTQCADPLVRAFSDEPDALIKISELIADHRYADAVADRVVDPDLRFAFQATWEIDEFHAAYALLEP